MVSARRRRAGDPSQQRQRRFSPQIASHDRQHLCFSELSHDDGHGVRLRYRLISSDGDLGRFNNHVHPGHEPYPERTGQSFGPGEVG